MTNAHVAKVVVELRTKAIARPFDYLVPPSLQAHLRRGQRVLVSFGRQMTQGYVVDLTDDSEGEVTKLKPILTILEQKPILSAELLGLCEWLTDRYVCTMLEAIHTVLPSAFRTEAKRQYRRTDSAEARTEQSLHTGLSAEMQRFLDGLKGRSLSAKQLIARLGEGALLQLPQAMALGLVEEVIARADKVNDKFETFVSSELALASLEQAATVRDKRAPKQAEIIRKYVELSRSDDLVPAATLGIRPSDPAVCALVRDEVIQLTKHQVFRDEAWLREVSDSEDDRDVTLPTLTSWQERALRSIENVMQSQKPSQVLLHGVTGSGKTEVYMRAIESCLARGRGAIVLVPEISLTPQMVTRFTSRFGKLVAVLHSGLSAGERKDAWARIQEGTVQVVIGARSAVFAPLPALSLIIVDEEHEPSYKQDETPFYDAREVALWRTRYHQGTVIYGSATPSLEAMNKVESGTAVMTSLPERVGHGILPAVQVVDMREELKAGNRSLFSTALSAGLEDCVVAGHQAILFLNRRGYSAFLLCRNCGERIVCPNCDISLTLHKGRNGDYMRCHYCHYTAEVPSTCPACQESAMRPFGIGTQQIEEHLHERWPNWRVLRMDVDTTRRKGAHHDLIGRFERG